MRPIKEHKNIKTKNSNYDMQDYINDIANEQERRINPKRFPVGPLNLGPPNAKILIGTGILLILMILIPICFLGFDFSSIYSYIGPVLVGGISYVFISSGLYRLKQEKLNRKK